MTEIITIAANAIVAKIIEAPDPVKDLVTQWLSYVVEGHERMTAFASGGWNGRKSFYSRRSNTFPAGFVHLVHQELRARGYTVRIVQKGLVVPLGAADPVVDTFGNADPRYDFQPRSLRQVEKHGRGIIQVATGGGKSKVAKMITAR